MKHQLFHATKPTIPAISAPSWPADYRLVAEVEAPSIEAVFRLTNSHDRHWSLRPGVACFAPNARSTSVGDVVVTPGGRVFRCESRGWQELASAA